MRKQQQIPHQGSIGLYTLAYNIIYETKMKLPNNGKC